MADEERKEAVAPPEGTPDELSQEDLKSVAGGIINIPSVIPVAPIAIHPPVPTNPLTPKSGQDDWLAPGS
jgi:hypothetical protein